MAVDVSKLGGIAGSVSQKSMAAIINEEILLHKDDLVIIPGNTNDDSVWGKNPQLDANFVICSKYPNGDMTKPDEGYAMYPGAYSRTVTVGVQDGDTFVKTAVVDVFRGTFVDKYMTIRRDKPGITEGSLMDALKGLKFKVTEIKEAQNEWTKGWEAHPDKPGKRRPSNMWKNAKQGYRVYTLDLVP